MTITRRKGNMKRVKHILAVFFLLSFCSVSHASTINVFINVRGNTGIEKQVSDVMAEKFLQYDMVSITDSREDSHLYLDLSLVEQGPIRFYGMGISIAYHVKGHYYSRPTSDAAQFGIDRMEEVCGHLAKAIDRAYLEPLRQREAE